MKYFSFDIDFYIDKLKHGKSSKPALILIFKRHTLLVWDKKKKEEDEMTYVLLI